MRTTILPRLAIRTLRSTLSPLPQPEFVGRAHWHMPVPAVHSMLVDVCPAALAHARAVAEVDPGALARRTVSR